MRNLLTILSLALVFALSARSYAQQDLTFLAGTWTANVTRNDTGKDPEGMTKTAIGGTATIKLDSDPENSQILTGLSEFAGEPREEWVIKSSEYVWSTKAKTDKKDYKVTMKMTEIPCAGARAWICDLKWNTEFGAFFNSGTKTPENWIAYEYSSCGPQDTDGCRDLQKRYGYSGEDANEPALYAFWRTEDDLRHYAFYYIYKGRNASGEPSGDENYRIFETTEKKE